MELPEKGPWQLPVHIQRVTGAETCRSVTASFARLECIIGTGYGVVIEETEIDKGKLYIFPAIHEQSNEVLRSPVWCEYRSGGRRFGYEVPSRPRITSLTIGIPVASSQ
jgi:hypothetical protein